MGIRTIGLKTIGLPKPKCGPLFLWNSYWLTRKPSNPVLTVLSNSSIKVDWTDAAEAADGLKIYFNDVLKDTVAFGVGTSTITGLTGDTLYSVDIVAYRGTNESDPITATATTLVTWSYNMLLSFLTINNHATWTQAQKDLVYGRLNDAYTVATFGPAGLNKEVCDFFIFFETKATLKTVSTELVKTGATLRWDYGGGNIYSQTAMPAQISTTEITITSTDGFGTLTRLRLASSQFVNNIPNLPYYLPNSTRVVLDGGSIASGTRLKGDISGWVFNNDATSISLSQHDVTGVGDAIIIPDKCTSFLLTGCTYLTGNTPKFNATFSAASATVEFSTCRFTGLGGTSFPKVATTYTATSNCFSTANITSFIAALNTYYSANAPTGNFTLTIGSAGSAYSGTITGGDANADLVNVKAVFVAAGKVFAITYNTSTYLLTSLAAPMLVLTSDDTYTTDLTYFLPLMQEYGKVGTSYLKDVTIGAAGHLTDAEVATMVADGWDFEAHPAIGANEAAFRAIMDAFVAFFTDHSIPAFNHIAWDQGTFTDWSKLAAADYVDTARTTLANDASPTVTNVGGLIYKDTIDRYAMYGISTDPIDATGVTNIKKFIDIAKIKSAGVIIYFHDNISAENVPLYRQIIDYAIAQGFTITDIPGLYAAMTA